MVLLPRSQCLTLLQELGHLMGLEHLKQVHGQMMISGLCRQAFAVSKLVELYCFDSSDCERREYARHIYRQAEEPERQMIFTSVLGACARSSALLEGRQIHAQILKTGIASDVAVLTSGVHFYAGCKVIDSASQLFDEIPEGNVFIGTGLVDMYSKCGCLSSSSQVFERMKKRNVLTWTAMMAGLAIHGQGKEAMELLDAMVSENVTPNTVTFTCLLNACRHTGLVEEGLHLFESMSRKFGVTPSLQHYGCIADLLGRAGQLEEAYKFVSDMPLKPDAILWRSLLGACKTHGNAELGEKVGKLLLQLEQGCSDLPVAILPTSEDYVALSNMYASAGRWDNVGEMREMMKVKGIQNRPGCSAIQSCNSVNSL